MDTLLEVCRLRARSVRGQLDGTYPATLAQQLEHPHSGVDASHVELRNLGDFQDLKEAGARQTQESDSGSAAISHAVPAGLTSGLPGVSKS